MANEKVDVVIIGSGASGAAAAWSLADTRMRILCLEQGGHMHQDDYPSNGMDWEWRTGIGDFSVNPNTRMNHWDYPINDTETPIKPAMYNAVGGSTILWTAHFPRFRPNDFKVVCEGKDRSRPACVPRQFIGMDDKARLSRLGECFRHLVGERGRGALRCLGIKEVVFLRSH